jgi:Protein of unknown function (DUF732)
LRKTLIHTKSSVGKLSTIATVPLSAAALLFAPLAAADQGDDAFIASLQRHNIAFTDRGSAITAGHSMCSGLDRGQTPTSLMMSVVRATPLSAKDAGYLLGASVASYCPQHKGAIEN